MSGGSFGYMGRVEDMQEVLEKAGWLPELADRLAELGHEDAAGETRALHERLLQEPAAFRALVKVWGAVDYHGSNDYGPEQVTEAVAEWRRAQGAASPQTAPEEPREYFFCGATIDHPGGTFTCMKRVAHRGVPCSPDLDKD